jgi:putative pre-16S rRNA nuclease
VGIALSDAAGRLATPLEVLTVRDRADAMAEISKIIQTHEVTRLVMGMPLNMDGSVGPAARDAAQFGRELAAKIQLPVIFVDERLSSFQAEGDLNDRKRQGEKLTRKKKKSRLDALAAALFLQEFLDGKLTALEIPF